MLGLVKVAVGHVGKVLQAGDGEQIVAVRRFPYADEIRDIVTMIPEITGADLETPRRAPMVGMAGDADRVPTADL